MILKSLLSQSETEAYIMEGKDYKEGHPAYHPFVHISCDSDYLVVQNTVLLPTANNYILIDATDEEKQRLIVASYQMIGLK